MRMTFLGGALCGLALAGSAAADAPSVAVDIPPIHSLVAMVMDGVGTPALIVQPGASPHGYSLRPSEAKTLQDADIVFWNSESMTPWLEGPIETLAADARSVELLEADGTVALAFREGATFESHDTESSEHAEGSREHSDHGHDHHDPHAWLDPENARVWLDVIAAELFEIDPEHGDLYAANAEVGRAALQALVEDIDAELAPLRDTNYIVFHDAYQYFETRFRVSPVGSITLGDASDPSPARIAEIRDKAAALDVRCAFAEPQFDPGLVRTVFQDIDARVGVLDPLGVDLQPGPDLYPQLIRTLADNLIACLK